MRALTFVVSLSLSALLLAACGSCGGKPAAAGTDSPVVTPPPSATPAPSPNPIAASPTDPIPCSADADCEAGLICTAFEGCGPAALRCEPPRACTRDLVQYCGCDGKTFEGSGSCPPMQYVHKGPCE